VGAQLTLLPTSAHEVRRDRLPLQAIDGFADAVPSAKLRELIRDLGLLQPIVVVPGRSGRYRVVEGRRRCKAIAELAATRDSSTPPCVDALIVAGGQADRREVRGGLTLALHATRTASPASELQAIETILAAAGTESEALTVKEIAAQTGMSLQTVRRRLRLRTLTPALRAAFEAGQITASVAEAAARLPEARQQALEQKLETAGRLNLTDVREAAREQTAAATAELPGAVFEEREVAWPVTVRGHLTAALRAMPPDGGQAALQRRIGDALVSLETVDAAT
jgi:ParB-like chromosome segregation protein Spo0J